ncbi:Cysteine proteinase, partial [Rhizoctonia solani]
MAPLHLNKRRHDYIESPNRNRRCMDDRKKYILDDSIRTHCDQDPDTSGSMFESAINTVSTWFDAAVRSVSGSFSAPVPPSHSPPSKRPKRKPRRITTNGDPASPTHAAQIPLPPSPTDPSFTDPSLPFQNLQRHNGTLPSPSTRRTNGCHTSTTASPTLSHSFSASSSRSPRRGGSTAVINGITKPYKRQHIRHRQHQEEVKQKLIQELFTLKTSAGQSPAEFKDYINYAARIDKIDAAGGVFAVVSKHVSQRRSFTPKQASEVGRTDPSAQPSQDDLSSEFLRKAIKRATDSLYSIRIPNNLPYYINELKELCKASEESALPKALAPEDQSEVTAALSKRGTVAKFAREQVSDSDLARLKPAQWLNDEVINFYGALILARSEEAQKGKGKALDTHYFNTFFFAKLEDMGYEKSRIGKWTKKIDIFKKDIVLIPVNLGNAHWTCAAINFQKKRIEYHDSMGRKRGKIYKILRDYLSKEHKDKKKKDFDFTGWDDYFDDDAPQQENGYDCGVFSCQYMECLSRGAPFAFGQENMAYLRQRMILEIMRGKLWDQQSI